MSPNLDGGAPWRDLRSGTPSEILFRFGLRRAFLITLLVGAALGFFVNLPSILNWAYRQWEVGKQFDQRTFKDSQFALRVTAFHQRGAVFAAAGGFYRYEVKSASDWKWRTIGTFRYSRPEQITSDHLRRITGSCAYFFHEHIFGVTTDGGTSWLIKGGPENPPICGRQTNPAFIESVSIGANGSGIMQLTIYDDQLTKWLPNSDLVTSDFGKSWNEK